MYLIIKSLLLQADILVSSAGACSQAILAAGGPPMPSQNVLNLFMPWLYAGEIIVTPGLALDCNHVIHTFCSRWRQGTGETVSV